MLKLAAVSRSIVVISLSLLAVASQAQRPPEPPVPPRAPQAAVALAPAFSADTILVKPANPGNSLAAEHAALGAQVVRSFERIGGLQILRLPPGLDPKQAIEWYERTGRVEYAEPDYIVSLDQSQWIPNDPDFGQLWGMNNTGQSGGTADADIDAPEAWSIWTDASSVIVGVIDTGVDYNHPDLAANMWVNPGEIAGNGVDDDSNGWVDDIYGIDTCNQDADPMDDHYHGTHVAGTVGAVGNNGVGVVGVSPTTKIMALKFLCSNGSGSSANAITLIDYAVAHGARILNNSWGGGGFSQALYDSIEAANQANVVFAAAAGNSAVDADASPHYPSSYTNTNVISVQSTDRNDQMSGFSNYGATSVDLGAPGSSIYSTYPTAHANGPYSTISGTSMATPHVAGALTLLAAYRTDMVTDEDLIDLVMANVDPLSNLDGTTVTGGRLNVYNAMLGTIPVQARLQATPTSGDAPLTVTFTDNSSGGLSTIVSRSLDFGDGSPATETTNTTHVYSTYGTYTATLTVVGADSTQSTDTVTINVTPNYTVAEVTYAWVDTASLNTVSLSDDSYATISLPFDFPFYGNTYSQLYMGSNGLVGFGSTNGVTTYTNAALPNTTAPNNAIYPYWDDLNPAVGTPTIRYGLAAPGQYVLSWENIQRYSDSSTELTFQVVLEETGGIVMQYLDATGQNGSGVSATVGVENADGSVFRQYSYNSITLSDGMALRFDLPQGPPAAASALSATATQGPAVDLSWNDNSGNESGFRIERTGGAGPATLNAAANATSLTDTSVDPATAYTYQVIAYNSGGDADGSNTADVTTLEAPPAQVQNVAASNVTADSITVTWDDAANETGYRLERSVAGSSFSTLIDLAAGVTSHTDTGLNPVTQYSYRVTAYNAGGFGQASAAATETTLDIPPAAVTLAAGTITSTSIALSWSDAANESTYELSRSEDGTTFALLASPAANVTSYTDSGLTPATGYWYRIVARNSQGPSPDSNVVSVTTLEVPPNAASGLTVGAVTASSIALSWTDNSDNEEGFRVERAVSGGSFSQVASLGAGVTTWTDTGLSYNTAYSYRVVAWNTGGGSAEPSSQVTQTTDNVVPAAATGLSVGSPTTSSLTLAWDDNSDNEDGFRVERSTDGISFAAVTETGEGVKTFLDTGLDDDTEYTYRVVAVNDIGDGAASNTAVGITLLAVPATPTGLGTGAVTATSITLTWTDNADNEANYRVERAIGGGSWAEVTTLGANAGSYVDVGLTPVTSYTYRVFASNTAGDSGASNTALATTPDVPPAPASNLAVGTVTATSIALTWTDNSGNEGGFEVQRAVGGGSFTVVATTDQNVEAFTDTGLTPETTYTYQVVATNFFGDAAPSNQVSPTTPMVPPAAPANVAATAVSTTEIDVTWDDVATESGYRVERSTNATSGFTQVASLAANATSFSDSGLNPATAYFYRVIAENAGGSATSAVASATTDSPPFQDFPVVSELAVEGQAVTGDFTATAEPDGVAETVTEVESKGKPRDRHPTLEHQWTINVGVSGMTSILWRAWGSDGVEEFWLEYSRDGVTWEPMVAVPVSDAGVSEFLLPDTAAGSLFVRVVDTDTTPGAANATFSLDYLVARVSTPSGNVDPTASDDSATTALDTAVDIDVLANDGDANGDLLTIDSVTQPANGSAAIVGSQVRYTPNPGYSGPDSFTYTISDGNGGSATASVAITVQGAPSAITLTANGFKVKGAQAVDLTWEGATSINVVIARDGVEIATVPNSAGQYTDSIGAKGGATYVYTLCESENPGACSDPATVIF